ncbi:MAG: DUF1446 domain-containing protein [Pirellulales bacterium]|nr:DUF1446 domain-containing protein [Pirellulales bacterium]
MPILRIANGAGFLGDNLDAPRRLVERAQVDYLTLEYLAELTMSILARQREKNPEAGFATDFIEVLKSLLPALKTQAQLKIITNAGGVNPAACAAAAGKMLDEAGLGDTSIGLVWGDDLLPQLDAMQAGGCRFENLDTSRPLAELRSKIVCANAYLGARPIAETLAAGARIVITGRVADASLTVGPAMHEFHHDWDDWNFLAGVSVAGHLIECGAQVTGGLFRHWEQLNLADVGYPIAEIADNGTCVIAKPGKTGGMVNRRTVIEQLGYEIGDPRHYLTPDVDVDFTTVQVEDIGPNRVAVRGATGCVAPESYKVSMAFQDGFAAAGQLLVYGSNCIAKARACGDMIFSRLQNAGLTFENKLIECLGAGDGVPEVRGWKAQRNGQESEAGNLQSRPREQASGTAAREVVLRVAVQDTRRDAVERFTREFAPLITSGPPGLAGYAAGRPQVRPVYAYWPTLVPKKIVVPQVCVRPAAEWIS